MKGKLLEAIAKKDPDELASTLKELERKVPPGKISDTDRDLKDNAINLLDELNAQTRIVYLFRVLRVVIIIAVAQQPTQNHFQGPLSKLKQDFKLKGEIPFI